MKSGSLFSETQSHNVFYKKATKRFFLSKKFKSFLSWKSFILFSAINHAYYTRNSRQYNIAQSILGNIILFPDFHMFIWQCFITVIKVRWNQIFEINGDEYFWQAIFFPGRQHLGKLIKGANNFSKLNEGQNHIQVHLNKSRNSSYSREYQQKETRKSVKPTLSRDNFKLI